MKYTSKLIIKETAAAFNEAVQAFLNDLPRDIKVISCDHNVSFKNIVAKDDALFSCLIVLAKV